MQVSRGAPSPGAGPRSARCRRHSPVRARNGRHGQRRCRKRARRSETLRSGGGEYSDTICSLCSAKVRKNGCARPSLASRRSSRRISRCIVAVAKASRRSSPPATPLPSCAASSSRGRFRSKMRCTSSASAVRRCRRRRSALAAECRRSSVSKRCKFARCSTPCKIAAASRLANFNSPTQIVISGELDAVQSAGQAMLEAGAKRVVPLNVSGAWHSVLMEPARARVRPAVEASRFSLPPIVVISNVDGRPYRDPRRSSAI